MDTIKKLHNLTKEINWRDRIIPLPSSWNINANIDLPFPNLSHLKIIEHPEAIYFSDETFESWLFPINPLFPSKSILLIFENQNLIGGLELEGDMNNPHSIAHIIKNISTDFNKWRPLLNNT